MPNYYHDLDKRQSYNRRRKARRVILIFGLIILILAVGIYIWRTVQTGASKPIVIKPPSKSYYAGTPKRIFQSDRFKFESTSNWQLSQEESLGTSKYVYFTHSLNNNLIEYELDILFDKSLDGKGVNYVMPVTIQNGKLKADVLSERCGDSVVAQRGLAAPETMAMQFHGTSYLCEVKGSTEKAAVGLVGGAYDIPLTTPAGKPVVLNIGFVNNSSSSFGAPLKEVLESFTLK